MNNNVTQKVINEFVEKIQKEDTKNNNVTRKLIDGFVKKIQNGDTKNSNVTQKPIDWLSQEDPERRQEEHQHNTIGNG